MKIIAPAILLLCALAGCGGGGGGSSSSASTPQPVATFFATWSAPPQDLTEALPGVMRGPVESLADQTLRQIAHVSAGGDRLRLGFSNLFGTRPVTFTSVHVARSLGGSAIDTASDRTVTFAGNAVVTLAPGAEVTSDEVNLPVARGGDLAVSLYVASPAEATTGHLYSNSTVYLSIGNTVAAPVPPGGALLRQSIHWLSAISVASAAKTNVVVAFGDSITEGSQSTLDGNRRYPDQLSDRAAAEADPRISVVNAGIGGNRWIHDFPGPGGASRFERDVLGVPGVTHTIILLGINDLEVAHLVPQQAVTVAQLIAATESVIAKAKARGVKVLLGTLLPFKGSAIYDVQDDAKRQAYNAWVRANAAVDAVVDFDAALRDPSDPAMLAPRFASADPMHPNDAGYGVMAAIVDLSKLR